MKPCYLIASLFSICYFTIPAVAQQNGKPVDWFLGTWVTETDHNAGTTIFLEPGTDKRILEISFSAPCPENSKEDCLIGSSKAYGQFLDDSETMAYELMGRFKTLDGKSTIKFFLQPNKENQIKALIYIAKGELAKEVEVAYNRINSNVNTDPRRKPEKIKESVGDLGVIKESIKPVIAEPVKPKIAPQGKIYGQARGLNQFADRYTVYIQKQGTKESWFVDPQDNGYYELDQLEDGTYLVSILIKQGFEDKYAIKPQQIDHLIRIVNNAAIRYDWRIEDPNSAKFYTNISGILQNCTNCSAYQVVFRNKNNQSVHPARFNSKGDYEMDNLPPGQYTVSLEFAGKADGIVKAEPYTKIIIIKKQEKRVLNFRLK